MDQVIAEIARQTPALLVLAFLIVQQAKERVKEREFSEGDRVFRKTMSDHCHEIQTRTLDTLDKCTEALGRTCALLDRMSSTLERMDAKREAA